MKAKLIAGIAALIVVIGGLGAGWYFYFQEPDPQGVLKKMVLATQTIRSTHYTGALEMSMDISNTAILKQEVGNIFLSPGETKLASNFLMSGDMLWL